MFPDSQAESHCVQLSPTLLNKADLMMTHVHSDVFSNFICNHFVEDSFCLEKSGKFLHNILKQIICSWCLFFYLKNLCNGCQRQGKGDIQLMFYGRWFWKTNGCRDGGWWELNLTQVNHTVENGWRGLFCALGFLAQSKSCPFPANNDVSSQI